MKHFMHARLLAVSCILSVTVTPCNSDIPSGGAYYILRMKWIHLGC